MPVQAYRRRVYHAQRPYYAAPLRAAPVPLTAEPVPSSRTSSQSSGVEADVMVAVQKEAGAAKQTESQEVEVVSGVDNHSSSKAKILPVSVNVTADAGVKLVIDALNDLLRQGLLNEAPAPIAPPPPSQPPVKTSDILVDVDVEVKGASNKDQKVSKIISVTVPSQAPVTGLTSD